MPHPRRLSLPVILVALLVVPVGGAAEPADDSGETPKMRFVDQGGANKQLAGYRTPEGLALEVVAQAPVVVHPVALTFAPDGTPYVVERRFKRGDDWRDEAFKVTYKDGTSRDFIRKTKKTRDVVKALVASRPGGTWDGSKVVLEVDQPGGILHHDGWLYLASSGAVRRYKASKSGGPLDTQQVVAQGFSAHGPQGGSGLAVGPDGWLYIACGAGDHFAEGSDGSRATVLRTGAVFRCRPDGTKLQVYAVGFQNPQGAPTFDTSGHLFLADGAPSGTGYRLIHVADRADYGWRLAHGSRTAADPWRSALLGERPGSMPPMLAGKTGSSSGVLIYNDSLLHEAFRGLLLHADPAKRAVRAASLTQEGATFAASADFDLLSAGDAAFSPRQLVVGPDGALYVVDARTSPGNKAAKEGRIYRLRWSGTKDVPAVALRGLDSWAKTAAAADGELIKALASPDASLRETARGEIVRRGDKARPALLKILADEEASASAQISAIGALQSMYNGEVQKGLLEVLAEGGDDVRRVAVEALGVCAKPQDADVHASLVKLLSVEDRDLRRAVIVAMGRVGRPGAADSLAAALSFDKTRDRYLHDGIVGALDRLGKPGVTALLSLAESGVQKDTDRVAATFLRLRSRAALDAFPELMRSPHLSATQRGDLVRSCLNHQDEKPLALDSIVALVADNAKASAPEIKAALDILGVPGTSAGAPSEKFAIRQLGGDEGPLRLAALGAAERLRLPQAVPVLLKALADSKSLEQRLAITRTLRYCAGKDRKVIQALSQLMAEESAELQAEALRGLAALDVDAATVAAKKALASKDEKLQAEAKRLLAEIKKRQGKE